MNNQTIGNGTELRLNIIVNPDVTRADFQQHYSTNCHRAEYNRLRYHTLDFGYTEGVFHGSDTFSPTERLCGIFAVQSPMNPKKTFEIAAMAGLLDGRGKDFEHLKEMCRNMCRDFKAAYFPHAESNFPPFELQKMVAIWEFLSNPRRHGGPAAWMSAVTLWSELIDPNSPYFHLLPAALEYDKERYRMADLAVQAAQKVGTVYLLTNGDRHYGAWHRRLRNQRPAFYVHRNTEAGTLEIIYNEVRAPRRPLWPHLPKAGTGWLKTRYGYINFFGFKPGGDGTTNDRILGTATEEAALETARALSTFAGD